VDLDEVAKMGRRAFASSTSVSDENGDGTLDVVVQVSLLSHFSIYLCIGQPGA